MNQVFTLRLDESSSYLGWSGVGQFEKLTH